MTVPKVSIVVPVYGVEAYIERCSRSLFEQTLDSLEYIFVNDCTPDDSMSVLRRVLAEYPERREQVRIIDQPYNMGAAKAREVGIKAATGEYIIHCDSDDWVERNAYASMYAFAKTDDYDVVIGDYCEHDGNHPLRVVRQQIGDEPLAAVIGRPVICSLWNKMVKHSLFDHPICYPERHMQEDSALCIQTFYYAKHIGQLDPGQVVYNYYINRSSITHEESEAAHLKRWEEAYDNTRMVCQFAQEKGFYKKYQKEFLSLQANVRGFLMPLMKRSNRYYTEWFHCFPQLNWRYLFLPQQPVSLKMVFMLTLFGLYPIVGKRS